MIPHDSTPVGFSPRTGPAGGDLDGLLSDFFKAQMPAPWPAAPRVRGEAVVMPSAPADRRDGPALKDPTFRSKLSLAASVALLVGGCWYLSGRSWDAPAGRPTVKFDGPATANAKHLKNLVKPEPAKTPAKTP